MDNRQEKWSGNWGFLLAAAGSAIGLGNLWKFPYITGVNGGGAFVLVYLVCILIVGLPLMICELAIGRATGQNPVGAFRKLVPCRSQAAEALGIALLIVGALLILFGKSGFGGLTALLGVVVLRFGWRTFGFVVGVLVPVLITAYYGVIGGWTFLYVVKSFTGALNVTTPDAAAAMLAPVHEAQPGGIWEVLAGQIGFMAAAGGILWAGVRNGIERWSKILMPVLFILLAVLIVRSLSLENSGLGLEFFLSPDFSKLGAAGVLTALGHAFFTLSLAMGIMITYGSYMHKDQNIVRCSLQIIGLDTLASIMAGLAIFPAVFAMGGAPNSGPTLLFEVLPATFNQIPGGLGWLWNGIFFVVLSIAALTSAISLLENPVSVLIRQFGFSRHLAVAVALTTITALGSICALSMANWNNLPELGVWLNGIFQSAAPSLFDALDGFTADWMLPIGGLLTAIFVGWVWGPGKAMDEIRNGAGKTLDTNIFVLMAGFRGVPGYRKPMVFTPALLWAIFVRFLSPLGVLLAFLYGIKVINL